MARINLLPWRETLRKKRQRDFGIFALAAVLFMGAAAVGVHFYIEGMVDSQVKRNSYLKKEIAAMDRKIKEIKELEKMVKQLESALATSGLPRSARAELQALKRKKRAQLVRLLTRESMDFGGILTSTQVERIKEVLKRAKQDVARKKKAAAFLATVIEVADISLSIVGKVVAV